MNSIIRLDTRGRLVIPNEFREALNLKKGDEVLLSMDTKTNTLIISPIYGQQCNLAKIELEFGDSPGCLAKIANFLAGMKIDLVMTESKSFQRGKKARWNIIADISRSIYSIDDVRKNLLLTDLIESISIDKINRGGELDND